MGCLVALFGGIVDKNLSWSQTVSDQPWSLWKITVFRSNPPLCVTSLYCSLAAYEQSNAVCVSERWVCIFFSYKP